KAWAIAAALLVIYGIVFTATRVNLSRLDNELAFRGDAHLALHDILHDPKVRAGMRCGPINVPNHKLVPDVRWMLDLPNDAVLTRSEAIREVPETVKGAERARQQRRIDAVARRIEAGGVQLIPHERLALFRQALVAETDDPFDNLPLPGFRRLAFTDYYAAYVRC
ncbi:MAG: hypothetical protein ABW167_08990, partial [Baekduia sp.]